MRQSILTALSLVLGLAIAGPASSQVLVVPPDSNYSIGIDRDGHARPLPMPPGIGSSPGLQVFPAPFLDRDDRRHERPKEDWELSHERWQREQQANHDRAMRDLNEPRSKTWQDDE